MCTSKQTLEHSKIVSNLLNTILTHSETSKQGEQFIFVIPDKDHFPTISLEKYSELPELLADALNRFDFSNVEFSLVPNSHLGQLVCTK